MAKLEVTTPSDREIRMTRLFEAPRELVYRAHTEPELVKRWMLGPEGWSMPVCEIDLRVGGRYRNVWRSDADGTEFGNRGVFREIEAPSRLVQTESMDGFDAESLNTMVLSSEGGKTRLTSTMVFPNKEARDGAIASGMEHGVADSYDRLEAVLSAVPA